MNMDHPRREEYDAHVLCARAGETHSFIRITNTFKRYGLTDFVCLTLE